MPAPGEPTAGTDAPSEPASSAPAAAATPRGPAAIGARRLALELTVVAVLSLVLAVTWLEVWKADLRVPFDYGGDGLLVSLWVRTAIDHGSVLVNPAVGAPGVLHLHDFPQADILHLAIVKVLSLFVGRDFGLVMNLYFLLGFPLIACAGYAVIRRFRVGFGPALVASVLYAFLPSRLFKGEGHLFLDTFFEVPLGILVALWLCSGAAPLLRARGNGSGGFVFDLRGRRSWAAVAICIVVALTGLYYAFFVGVLLVVAGAWGGLAHRSWRHLAAGAALALVVVAGLGAQAVPTLRERARLGPNPEVALRATGESEFYGMKIAQLLLPVNGHRLPALRALKRRYTAGAPLVTPESDFTGLGVVGGVGFLALLGVTLFGARRARAASADADAPLEPLAAMNIAAVLFGTLGGFSSLFALLVTPQVRTYVRMNVVIAFLSLFAVALLLERLARSRRRGRAAVPAVLALALGLGLADQVSLWAVRDYAGTAALFRRDRDFVRRIEAAVPAGAMIFQLPYFDFPEVGRRGRVDDYEPMRPYLHSRTTRWSYPTMRGRAGDAWAMQTAAQPPDRLVETLGDAGFAGVLVDRAGYDDGGAAIEAALAGATASAGAPLVGGGGSSETRGGRYAFFALPAVDRTAAERARRRDRALHPVLLLWGRGFYARERDRDGDRNSFHWWSSGTGELFVVNDMSEEQTVSLSLTVHAARPPATFTIQGDLWSQRLTVPESGARLSHTLRVPPGRHLLTLRATSAPADTVHDSRRLVWRAEAVELTHLADPPPSAAP